MFCSKTSTLVLCILFSCLPKHYTSFVTAHHPILKLFVHKAPDINLINKYGLIHTIQDYIHWSILDEHMYPTFSVKLSWLVHERTLIKVYLQGRVKAKRICCNNLIPHLLRLAKSEMILQQLEDLILKHPYKVVRATITKTLEIDAKNHLFGLWIDLSDIFMSIHGLLMIQKTYLWLPHKICKDLKVDITSEVELTQKQTTEVGMCSLFRNMHTSALEWLEFSLELCKEETTKVSPYPKMDKDVSSDLLNLMIYVAIQKHNKDGYETDSTTIPCFMTLYTEPIYENTTKRFTFRQRDINQEIKRLQAGILNSEGVQPATQYINICSGTNQTVQPSKILAKLKCFYERSRHPFLYINPVKVEQLSVSPQVYQFYDIIGPKLVNQLVQNYRENASLTEILKSLHYYNGDVLLENIDATPAYLVRTTKNYNGHRIFYRLTEAVTGIKFEGASEDLQFLGYTVGKSIDAHEDIIRDHPLGYFKDIDGNRVACILYYLELPTLGGHTPFCQAGCKAHLVKGSAVIWFNKFRNGTNRNDMHHGACPVLQGTKLILAQAIEYIGQWKHFKCSLNQFD